MKENNILIEKTGSFLKKTFAESIYMQSHPAECAYRLEHTYRVANIGKEIAVSEGFDPTEMAIACLLHDISYCTEFKTREKARDHGRLSAKIARPFLTELGLPADRINDICFGIAIHVDDKADFEGEHTAFAETVSDADNIDRFDVYRIYENLQYIKFSELSLEEKTQRANSTLENLSKLRDMKLGTKTAEVLWKERIDYNIFFYNKLIAQLKNSSSVN